MKRTMKRTVSALLLLAICLSCAALLSSCAPEGVKIDGTYLGDVAKIEIKSDNTFTMESIKKDSSENGNGNGEEEPPEDRYALSGTVEFNSRTNTGFFFHNGGKENAPIAFMISDSGNMVVVFDDTSRSVKGDYVSYRIWGTDSYRNMLYGSGHTELFEKE